MPNATPKNTPEIMPKRCGISSCANTMIDDVADERIRPMNTVSTALAEQAGIGQRQRERQRAEDREPDDVFAAEAIAERSAEERAGRVGGEEDEEIELRRLGRDAELVDQIEDVIARQARDVELLREQQRDQHRERDHDAPRTPEHPDARSIAAAFLAAICGLYQTPIRHRITIARNAIEENQAIDGWPNGTTISAASTGPIDVPKLPPS